LRRRWSGVAVAVAVLMGFALSNSAAASARSVRANLSFPSGCKRTAFTGDGGYFSMGQFYWEPSDTVTITAKWCYSGGVITSKNVSYTTSIPSSLDPQLTEYDSMRNGGRSLNVQVAGDYESGVLNNVGFITLIGRVNASGHHHFRDISGDGG
jgi:hypothetical protein